MEKFYSAERMRTVLISGKPHNVTTENSIMMLLVGRRYERNNVHAKSDQLLAKSITSKKCVLL